MSDGYDMKTPEGHRRFVADNWELLAYVAYRGYLQFGRGAVVVSGKLNGSDNRFPQYTPLDGGGFGHLEQDRYVRKYDAEQEIVVIFNLRGFAVMAERYQGQPGADPLLVYAAFEKRRGTTLH